MPYKDAESKRKYHKTHRREATLLMNKSTYGEYDIEIINNMKRDLQKIREYKEEKVCQSRV